MQATTTRETVANWSEEIKVGEHIVKWFLTLRNESAFLRLPCLNEKGAYVESRHKITGENLISLLAIARTEKEQGIELMDHVKKIIQNYK